MRSIHLLMLVALDIALGAQGTTAGQLALEPYQAPPTPKPGDWSNERLVQFMRELTDYMLSEPARIIARLEANAVGTIQTWYEVWQEAGVIPSGWRTHNLTVKGWELSDVGNVAHLIKLIAYILMDRAGLSEWDLIRERTPAKPISASLPKSVLRAQGLR